MRYSRTSIKPFKGRLIKIHYTHKRGSLTYHKSITGRIEAATKESVLFVVSGNEDPELRLTYSQIESIEKLKRK